MEIRCVSCKNYFNDMFEVCPHCGYVAGAVPKEDFLLHPGMVLKNRYEIGMVLGYGGFGAIYKAWDTKLETSVAIKEYFQSGVVNRIPGDQKVFVFSDKKQVEYKEGLGRFLEEARNTVKFSKHDNIVNVYDYFEENGTAYIVMEYLQGKNLKDILSENDGSLDVDTSLKIFYAVLHALKAVHAEEVIHRDVSPDNIFLTDAGKIKLIDFGAARFTRKKQEGREIVVKQGFTPPEQYRVKEKQGAWTDIYSVGATMYRILTGVTPQESVGREVEDSLVAPNEIQPVIPEFLSSIIMKCMNLEPELRFCNIEEVKSALKKEKIIKSRKQEIRSRKRRRVFVFAMSLLLCGVIGIAGSRTYVNYVKTENEAPAQLSIWLMAEEGKEETERKAFETIAELFKEKYPNVSFEICCYSQEEYMKRFTEAETNGQLPDIYESTGIAVEKMPDSLSLTNTYKEISSGLNLNILQKRSQEQVVMDRLPISYDVPVKYDTLLKKGGETTVSENLIDFLNEKGDSYIGGVDCYLEVREARLGEYSISCEESVEPVFDNYLSINATVSKRERKKSLQFLAYLLEQQSQEILCIDYNNGLPVNQAAEETYFEVYKELTVIRQGLEEYISKSEEQ